MRKYTWGNDAMKYFDSFYRHLKAKPFTKTCSLYKRKIVEAINSCVFDWANQYHKADRIAAEAIDT